MNTSDQHHRAILQSIARRAMLERGLLPDFSAAALAELGRIQAPAVAKSGEPVRDLRGLLWASIDNDDSLDLDQLTAAEAMPGDKVKILMVIGADGSLQDSDICRARVRNHAKLAYNSVAAWLEGGRVPEAITAVNGLAENLRLQDRAAQRMKDFRHVHGALSLETI